MTIFLIKLYIEHIIFQIGVNMILIIFQIGNKIVFFTHLYIFLIN